MSANPRIQITFFSPDGVTPLASTDNPRKCVIKSGCGAMERRCWLELYNEDLFLPLAIGAQMEIRIDGSACFYGRIHQRRIDSVDDQLSLFAAWQPQREFAATSSGIFVNMTATQILHKILKESNIFRIDSHPHSYLLSRLHFAEDSIFAVIDLLAKLAGNWLWDMRDDGSLRFRPYPSQPDHALSLLRDVSTVNLWQTVNDLAAGIEFHGGSIEGGIYTKTIDIPQLHNLSEKEIIRIYVRSINAGDVYKALRNAIIQQMTQPHYEHYVDLMDGGEFVQPGEVVRFYVEEIPLFPQDRMFRVKEREIEYAHGRLKTRLHLTSGFESTPTYFYYFTDDKKIPEWQKSTAAGPFQLDVSALDSIAHIDGV
ncbi:MAG: hypothetical protein C4527_06095 [Candidatus Omnitrophota bacterium]|jgi:hypothetical protein|nr:MAG: hypothetical protein C4527_06095 [Candidatus Omnitrophota bacterium]